MDKGIEHLLEEALDRRALIAAVVSGPRDRKADACQKVQVRPVILRGQWLCQFAYHVPRKVTHRNLPPEEARTHFAALLAEQFRQAQVFTAEADYHVLVNRRGEMTVRRRPPSRAAADVRHDRPKRYLLEEGNPVDSLVRLGVMTSEGRVVSGRHDKFRQVNRFLEMVADVADRLPRDRPVRVVDFGCGRSYLTFALHHYLREVRGLDARLFGLDRKADVIAECRAIAADLDLSGLTFDVAEIAGNAGPEDGEGVDMVVALHACDTATDDALARAVRWQAKIILAAPCCQHELFRQVRSDALRPLLRHGILKERVSALVTDALRADLLELCGYAVQVLEFIETEHTPKNLLLRAVRQEQRVPSVESIEEYRAFRDLWNAHPALERALAPFLPESVTHGRSSPGGGPDRGQEHG